MAKQPDLDVAYVAQLARLNLSQKNAAFSKNNSATF